MEELTVKKGITIAGLITGGLFTYDATVLTGNEVSQLESRIPFSARQELIFDNIGRNKENVVDLSKITVEEYVQEHINILEKMGEKLSPMDKEKNLSKRIRSKAKKLTIGI